MKSIASAPAKVILFGEHFVVYGVKAILCAIDKRVTVTAQTIQGNKILIKSGADSLELELGKNVSEIVSPLKPFYYLADRLARGHDTGVQVNIESEIPTGAGLGSSSACCVATAAAISRLFKETPREKILELAIDAERTIFGNTSGADCTVCVYGGIIEYDKTHKFKKIETEPGFQLVVANSNMEHSTESMVDGVRQFRQNKPETFSKLCSIESELVGTAITLLENNDTKKLGEKMTENQEYLKAIGVSNEKLEEMIQIGQDVSFGAKITGAGGGGCIFALTDNTNQEQTITEFKNKNYDCFSVKIDFDGLILFN